MGCRIRFGRGGRCLGAAVCVTPAAPVRLHRIRNDQLYHRYLGDALDVLLLYPDRMHRVEVMGTRIASGQRLRVLIPGGTFHTARLVGAETWFLGARTEWPGVIPADVEPGNPAALARSFPDAADLIADFVSGQQLSQTTASRETPIRQRRRAQSASAGGPADKDTAGLTRLRLPPRAHRA